ncbi:MAG: DNA methyltransferase [Ponticaulis sp.]|nr:DNA methyltransferase [Ponticaulis sp.]
MIQAFLYEFQAKYQAGDTTEHAYRTPFETLFASLNQDIRVITAPERCRKTGSPDFTFKRRQPSGSELTIGVCERKDIGQLRLTSDGAPDFSNDPRSQEQFHRYLEASPNLLYTDGVKWLFFENHNARPAHAVEIARVDNGIQQIPQNFSVLQALLTDFVGQTPFPITTSVQLAQTMAAKAKLLRFAFRNALLEDEVLKTQLGQQFVAIRTKLISDITPEHFAGIYAETITYSLFAARLQSEDSPESFSRDEVCHLLPHANPFLHNVFRLIARPDAELEWVVEDLVEIFLVSHPREIMKSYGTSTARNDPLLHFYEDFLKAYDPETKDKLGVYYTPEPVVDFITRAIDDVLKTDFGLKQGLVDASRIEIEVDPQRGLDKDGSRAKTAETVKHSVPRVQVLDPAVGTGTFLSHIIKLIAQRIQSKTDSSAWNAYVETDLIPRLHGFELMLASYAMCHLKLDMELKATGYTPSGAPPRASVHLTNSLEEGHPTGTELMLKPWLADQALHANRTKSEKPIICVVGNPPYLGEGGATESWIGELMEAYKKEPGGNQKLMEKNLKWVNAIENKFIRLAQHYIEKNGEGVIGFITPHTFLEAPTLRGMRWSLLSSFDKLYVLDLHGNSKKKEVAPDGSQDKNVFDIQQGVAIIIGVRTKKPCRDKSQLAEVYHADLWGERQQKFETLWAESLQSINWSRPKLEAPNYYLSDRDESLFNRFQSGFSLLDLMPVHGVGICSKRDSIAYHEAPESLRNTLEDFRDLTEAALKQKYQVRKESRDQKVAYAMADIAQNGISDDLISGVSYRPFDTRYTYYSGKVRGFLAYPVDKVLKHLAGGRENLALITSRQGQVVGNMSWNLAFVSNQPTDLNVFYRGGGQTFPLYLYPDKGDPDQTRRVNFDPDLYKTIRQTAGLGGASDDAAQSIFDYIYGVLYSAEYRETFRDFLKSDYPRIPWPGSAGQFQTISGFGAQLRRLHLMQDKEIGDTPYPLEGDGVCLISDGFPKFSSSAPGRGQIAINASQAFQNVPETAWIFWIGGYQPAQKWLKDRKGQMLSVEDILHYQSILKILEETDRLVHQVKIGPAHENISCKT